MRTSEEETGAPDMHIELGVTTCLGTAKGHSVGLAVLSHNSGPTDSNGDSTTFAGIESKPLAAQSTAASLAAYVAVVSEDGAVLKEGALEPFRVSSLVDANSAS